MKDALIRIVEAFHKYNSEHMAAQAFGLSEMNRGRFSVLIPAIKEAILCPVMNMARTARAGGDSGICHVLLRGSTGKAQKHLTDRDAWELIRRRGGCENAAELQRPERKKRDAVPRKALKQGVSIRRASGLTGTGIGVIRWFVSG